jgi:hypothetical protein
MGAPVTRESKKIKTKNQASTGGKRLLVSLRIVMTQ